jgi:hypothetical protein
MPLEGGVSRRGLHPRDIAEARRILGNLLDSLEEMGCSRKPDRNERSAFAGRVYRSRRLRSKYFTEDLFADAAWDILLLLYSLEGEGKRVSVSAVCASAGVPESTGHRWIERLVAEGLVSRERHPSDRRVNWVRLSDRTLARMDGYFDDLLSSFYP